MGALRTQAREAGFSDRTILAVESGFDWGHLYQACKSNSLFSEKSWVELRLSSGKPGTEGARHLESIHQLSHPDLILLVLLPALDYATRQSQWFKSLSKNTHLINAEAVHRHQLPRWIAQRLALQKQQANPDTLAFLVEHVEGHLLAAHQEILKLGLLVSFLMMQYVKLSWMYPAMCLTIWSLPCSIRTQHASCACCAPWKMKEWLPPLFSGS